jgi:hypothetical protein
MPRMASLAALGIAEVDVTELPNPSERFNRLSQARNSCCNVQKDTLPCVLHAMHVTHAPCLLHAVHMRHALHVMHALQPTHALYPMHVLHSGLTQDLCYTAGCLGAWSAYA